ncbi:hypothetical protein FB451DRAFT_1494465 [Mycena latifolia]|nr:hypothetical protein FB451DRAFT_1494465 [Mycena latifolia]
MPRRVPFQTDPIEFQTLAVLQATVRDPMSAQSCCARAIQTGLSMLTTFDTDEMTKDARQTPIIRAIMDFLTRSRSSQEQESLIKKLNACCCNLRDPAVARLHKGDSTGRRAAPPGDIVAPDFDTALAAMCSTISCVLLSRPMGKFRTVRKNTAADAQPWPNNLQDLITSPDGAKGTISALLQWATTPPTGYGVFMVLGAIARFWEPFAREIYRTPLAFSIATDHIQLALYHYYARSGTPPRRPEFDAKFDLPLIACADGFFLELVRWDPNATLCAMAPVLEQLVHIGVQIRPILHSIGRLGGGEGTTLLWFDQMNDLLQQLNIHQKQHSTLRVDFRRACYYLLFVALIAYWIIDTTTRTTRIILLLVLFLPAMFFLPNILTEDFDLSSATESALPSSNADMFDQFTHIRNMNQCMHLKCTTALGVKTAVCVKCGIVRYCGAQCQRAAWRAPDVPHKPVCDAIHSLRVMVQLEDSADWDMWVLRTSKRKPGGQASQFEALCSSALVSTELTLKINHGIFALTNAKRAQLDELEKQGAQVN